MDMLKKWALAIFTGMILSASVVFASDKININTATSQQLQQLNGVGAATADAIIKYRELNGAFKNVNELVNVKGIGDKKIEKIADNLSVSDTQ